jgi:hypothetical protein
MLRGMLASEEEGLAASNLGVVAWHIENNEFLARDFVDGQGNPYRLPRPHRGVLALRRHHRQPPGASKDPTWQAKGLDSKGVQGRRIDVLIADDLVTPKNSMSPDAPEARPRLLGSPVRDAPRRLRSGRRVRELQRHP